MRVRGDAPHDGLCPSNDGSPGPVNCDFCERLYSADARGYTRGWSAGYEQVQREGWQAGFDYAWPRGMQAQRDEVTYAETDDAYEQGQRDEREACIDTVWLVRDEKGYSNPEWQKRIVAAIRARSDGGES